MSDINKLVEYLNFEYKGEKNEDSTSIIVIDENFGTEESNIKEFLIVDLENNSLFKRLYLNTDFIYLDVSQEETIYYKGQIQANGPILYSNILSVDVWEELDDSNFITVTLNTQSEGFSTSFNAFPDGFYYNYEEATLYYKSLDTAFVYVKSFIFHYFYQDIADISNGTYLLNYKDNEGYTIDFGDSLLKYISETNLQTAISNNQRKITLTKATLSGMVFRFPKIRKGELKYLYKLPEGNFFPRTKFFDNDIAIHLSFATIYGQLEFLNQTVFDHISYFDEETTGTAGVFYKEYSEMVLFELKAAKFDDKLKIIYHLPVFFLVQIDFRDLNLWEVLGEMLENALTNAGTNKEDIAIKLLCILLEKDGGDMFLENLIAQKSENITYFSLLFEKLNGDNFVTFITFMWQVWINSKYVLPVNALYESFDSPWMLPFSSKKQFGFYFSNISVAYTQKENAIQFAYDTGQTEMIYLPALEGKEGLNPYKSVPVKEYYTYHVYQPLLLKDIEGNNQTALALLQKETLVPSFVLKANQEKQFWSNVVTAAEYVLDVVTTFSGVGNVLKFRYLTKLRDLALLSKGVSGADKVVRSVNILRNIKGAVGIVEISSGSLNLLLNITDKRNESPYKELSEVLFYLELLTIAGELTVPLKTGIRKSAKEAVEKSTPRIRKENSELFYELFKLGGIDDIGRKWVYVRNAEDIGKQGNKVVFDLMDELNNSIGSLTRTLSEQGRKTIYTVKIKGMSENKHFIIIYNEAMSITDDLPVSRGEQILFADINLPSNITTNYSGIGDLILDDSLKFFIANSKYSPDGVLGFWSKKLNYYKEYGGESINLSQFWKAVDEGSSFEESAFHTFTGQWAKRNGFDRVMIGNVKKDITNEKVIIKFIK